MGKETENKVDADKQALKDFLLDIESINKLNKWSSKFNLFDVLKIKRAEIRHSNVLAWLLDPNENHNLKDSVIRGLFEYLVEIEYITKDDAFKILLMDYYEFTCRREWNNIDILLVNDESKVVLAIENKIDSGEHDKQLDTYKKVINKHYNNDNDDKNNYAEIFLYLTPYGDESSDSGIWKSISYEDILRIIKNAFEKASLSPDVELLIQNYIDTVRWYIVGDEELETLCKEIYKKHKQALDLIYENKPDNVQEITDFIYDQFSTFVPKENKKNSDNFILHNKYRTKRCTYFNSKTVINLLPNFDEPNNDWKTNNCYYRIVIENKKIKVDLRLWKGNLDEDKIEAYFREIITASKAIIKTANWGSNSSKPLKSWEVMEYTDEITLEEIQDKLEYRLKSVFEGISKYEEWLQEEIKKLRSE